MSFGVASSVPQFEDFDPSLVPTQLAVLKAIRREHDYSKGPLEILLSGSVGSAKSILLAHVIATHVLMYPGAGVLVGRRTLKDLKNTLWTMLLEHLPMLAAYLNRSEMKITLPNKSVIYGVSWDDGNYNKFRSYPLSMAVIEELTENKDQKIYDEIRLRLGRLPHVPENLFICATNPESPSSWPYKYFIDTDKPNRRVFYSKTKENPFLPDWYYSSLAATLDAKMARRMLEGEWIEIANEVVYYAYGEHNVIDGYQFNSKYPLCLTWDFNIGEGKPMSAIAFQYVDKKFYFFEEFVIEGSRTGDVLDEMQERGLFNRGATKIKVYGDRSGKSNDTRSRKTDYAIIKEFLEKLEPRVEIEMCVPLSNPPVRSRHNLVNAALKNSLGETVLFIDKACKKANEGMRLVALKKGADVIEDDSKDYQHVTTAIGYAVHKILKIESIDTGPKTVRL